MRTLCLGNRIKLDHLPAGSQVTERNQRRFQASGLHVHFADGLLPKQKFL